MQVDIDISPRFEKQKATYLGMGGGIEDCVGISWKETRLLFRLTADREAGRGHKGRNRAKQQVRVYSIMCFLLLEPHLGQVTHVDIDRDFRGYKDTITTLLVNMFRKGGFDPYRYEINAEAEAGKGGAHVVANECRTGEREFRSLTAEEIFSYY